ncbi:hypothetical protein Tco_1256489 [Tanacetum coccineum]
MTSKDQQIALDNALVALENQRGIGKCNMRINPGMKPKESTNQIPGQEFNEPLSKEETLSFIRELGHSGEIKYITDVIVDHLHQPWRTFASTINKCLSGKDLAYQIDNKDSKKQDKMFYPRFTKIIIHHFLKKDKSISMRNRTFMHTARDDSLLGTMRFVSRHEDAQIYGVILPKEMTNQAMLDYVAYKTYYAIASGAEPPKSKKPKTKSDLGISYEETPSKKKTTKAKKYVPSKKKLASKPKYLSSKWLGGDDESNDDNSDEVTKDDDKDDVESYANDDKEAKEEDVCTHDSFEFNDDDEEYDELYKDVNVMAKVAEHEEVGKGDAEMTDTTHKSASQEKSYEQVIEDVQ